MLFRGTAWPTIVEKADLFVCFGGLPLKNTAVKPGGISRHQVDVLIWFCWKGEILLRPQVAGSIPVPPARETLNSWGLLPYGPSTRCAL
jgi:hypothetical protein